MSVRDTLLRQHRWRLEERQQFLAGLETLANRLRADAQRLEREVAEHKIADDGAAADHHHYPPLVQPLIDRRRRLERSIVEVEAQIEEARALVSASMQEIAHAEAGARTQPEYTPGRVGRRVRRGRPHSVRSDTRLRGI